MTAAAANAAIAGLTADLRAGSVSLEAQNLDSGAVYRFGASGGMWTASSIKLDFLEALLLHDQVDGTGLSEDADEDATAMIEHSDNDAADRVYNDDDGGYDAVTTMYKRLGLTATAIGTDDCWGLSTAAGDEIRLLRNLTSTTGPLDAASRRYALNLMDNVEADQRWGASAAADPGTSVAIKNGWLNIDNDDERYVVKSSAIVTTNGSPVLIAVLSQHNPDEEDGIELVQSLAKIAAGVIAPPSRAH